MGMRIGVPLSVVQIEAHFDFKFTIISRDKTFRASFVTEEHPLYIFIQDNKD